MDEVSSHVRLIIPSHDGKAGQSVSVPLPTAASPIRYFSTAPNA
jgi:hypothetical protein